MTRRNADQFRYRLGECESCRVDQEIKFSSPYLHQQIGNYDRTGLDRVHQRRETSTFYSLGIGEHVDVFSVVLELGSSGLNPASECGSRKVCHMIASLDQLVD